MKVIFAREELPISKSSIFLAGPTPRTADVASWRPEALSLLKNNNLVDFVFAPEDREKQEIDGTLIFSYPEQIDWERKALAQSSVVIFWVPRELKNMPAFTTNVEFGFIHERGQPFVLGFPKDAPKMRYLAYLAEEKNAPITHTLEDTIQVALKLLG
ncbi:MAG: hypothetical protein GY793_09840 [Proteobacteria bacterium]|nr:hypothetical protein [Pseudomonadota bacterium]